MECNHKPARVVPIHTDIIYCYQGCRATGTLRQCHCAHRMARVLWEVIYRLTGSSSGKPGLPVMAPLPLPSGCKCYKSSRSCAEFLTEHANVQSGSLRSCCSSTLRLLVSHPVTSKRLILRSVHHGKAVAFGRLLMFYHDITLWEVEGHLCIWCSRKARLCSQ
jgi:hypothetical protein